jgi:hypothetical protein
MDFSERDLMIVTYTGINVFAGRGQDLLQSDLAAQLYVSCWAHSALIQYTSLGLPEHHSCKCTSSTSLMLARHRKTL